MTKKTTISTSVSIVTTPLLLTMTKQRQKWMAALTLRRRILDLGRRLRPNPELCVKVERITFRTSEVMNTNFRSSGGSAALEEVRWELL